MFHVPFCVPLLCIFDRMPPGMAGANKPQRAITALIASRPPFRTIGANMPKVLTKMLVRHGYRSGAKVIWILGPGVPEEVRKVWFPASESP